jgi:uncharacterized membrane protein YqiK
MQTNELLPSLSLMTLIAVLVIAVIGLLLFLRKRRNRNAAVRAFYGSEAAPSDEESKRKTR